MARTDDRKSTRRGDSASCSSCACVLPAASFRTRNVNGHVYLRSKCKECERPAVKKAIAAWQKNNRARVNEQRRARPASRRKRSFAKWYAANGKEHRQTKRYKQSHTNGEQRRRARKLGAASTLTTQEWRELIAQYGGRCAYCNDPCSSPTQDHVVPLSRGGTHTRDNIVPACMGCNLNKRDKPVESWLRSRDLGRVSKSTSV